MTEFVQKCGCKGLKSRDAILSRVQTAASNGKGKITIVGAGDVGIACAITILAQGVTDTLCLIDNVQERMRGEMLDIQYGSMFLDNAKVTSGSDYSLSMESRLCIITSGVPIKEDESRMESLKENVDVIKEIIPHLIKQSPNTVLLILTNPVDIMTYVAWKISGLPKQKVFGLGTNTDSSRFQFILSQKFGIPASDCCGWIIGEHGDSCVVVWSGVNIAGVRLRELNPNAGLKNDEEIWVDVHKQVIDCENEVCKLKGHSCWADALATSSISRSIVENIGNVQAASVNAKGLHGITEDVFLSLPVAVGGEGITDIVELRLTDIESDALRASAKVLAETLSEIVL